MTPTINPNVWSCNPRENFLISNSFPYTGEAGGDGDFIAAIRSCFKVNTARQENGAINVSFDLQLEDVVRKAANEENYIVGILTGKTFNNFDDDFIQTTYEDKELPIGDDSILADKEIKSGFYLGENVSYFSQSNPSFSIVAKPQWISVPIGVEYTAQIVRENQKTGEKIKTSISSLRTETITFTHLKAYDENEELINYLIYEEIENPSDWDIEITKEEFNYLTDSKNTVIKNKFIGEIPPEPSYDETKIAVVLLDEDDEPTDNVTYFETIADSATYLKDNAVNRYLVHIGDRAGITSLERNAFYQCTNLVNIYIPETITSFGGSAFRECTELKFVSIPNNVISIGEYVFSGCSSLEGVTISDGIEAIPRSVFSRCTSLTDVVIPSSVTSIGIGAFTACTNLRSIIIPNGVTSIRQNAFQQCSSLASVNIPNGVTDIESWTFYECTSLTSVNIPNSVTSIGPSAFEKCSSLSEITIPSGVASITNNSFTDCANLTTITIDQQQGSISGAPWGATNATVVWTG